MARWGSTDFKQLQAFQKKLEKLARQDTDKFCRDCAKELAARLLAKVVPRTPVGRKPTLKQLGGDGAKKTLKVKGASGKTREFLSREGAILAQHWDGYMGGTLRRGWTAKTEAEAEAGSGSPGAPEIDAFLESVSIKKTGNEFRIEIENPVPYASYVEFGHRQAPGRYVPALGKRLKKSWVKGKFMLTISERELRTEAPKILDAKLTRFLREVFDGK